MTQPQPPNMFVARISGPLEMFSFMALIVGVLFKLQSWPFAAELLIIGLLGLLVAYLVLLPMRLMGLKAILPKSDFAFAMATGLCLGVLIGSSALLLVMVSLSAAFPVAVYILNVMRGLAALGVSMAFIWDIVRTQPQPNTAQYAIAFWLRRRLNIIMILVVINVIIKFLL